MFSLYFLFSPLFPDLCLSILDPVCLGLTAHHPVLLHAQL